MNNRALISYGKGKSGIAQPEGEIGVFAPGPTLNAKPAYCVECCATEYGVACQQIIYVVIPNALPKKTRFIVITSNPTRNVSFNDRPTDAITTGSHQLANQQLEPRLIGNTI